MSSFWIMDMSLSVYTKVKHRASKKLKTKYKDLEFTRNGEALNTVTSFPTVYIHEMPYAEFGSDLERSQVNGVHYGLQIDVTVSGVQGQATAMEVMYTVFDEFKRLGFNFAMTPQPVKTGDGTVKLTARVRRNIAIDDILN